MNPPLPEPAAWLITSGEDLFATNETAHAESFKEDERERLCTEAQLLAYRAEVIEMCAKEMEGMKSYAGEDIAAELRSLK